MPIRVIQGRQGTGQARPAFPDLLDLVRESLVDHFLDRYPDREAAGEVSGDVAVRVVRNLAGPVGGDGGALLGYSKHRFSRTKDATYTDKITSKQHNRSNKKATAIKPTPSRSPSHNLPNFIKITILDACDACSLPRNYRRIFAPVLLFALHLPPFL